MPIVQQHGSHSVSSSHAWWSAACGEHTQSSAACAGQAKQHPGALHTACSSRVTLLPRLQLCHMSSASPAPRSNTDSTFFGMHPKAARCGGPGDVPVGARPHQRQRQEVPAHQRAGGLRGDCPGAAAGSHQAPLAARLWAWRPVPVGAVQAARRCLPGGSITKPDDAEHPYIRHPADFVNDHWDNTIPVEDFAPITGISCWEGQLAPAAGEASVTAGCTPFWPTWSRKGRGRSTWQLPIARKRVSAGPSG
jgi:hypothetical protein